MKKILIVYFLGFCFVFCCCADEREAPSSLQLSEVDSQLKVLHQKLHELRLKSMQEEISGQSSMFEEWAKFADHMKLSEKYEEEAKHVQRQIEELETKRKLLEGQVLPSQPKG